MEEIKGSEDVSHLCGVIDTTAKELDRTIYPELTQAQRLLLESIVVEIEELLKTHELRLVTLTQFNLNEINNYDVVPLEGNNLMHAGGVNSTHNLMSKAAKKCGVLGDDWSVIAPRLGHLQTRIDPADYMSSPRVIGYYIDTV